MFMKKEIKSIDSLKNNLQSGNDFFNDGMRNFRNRQYVQAKKDFSIAKMFYKNAGYDNKMMECDGHIFKCTQSLLKAVYLRRANEEFDYAMMFYESRYYHNALISYSKAKQWFSQAGQYKKADVCDYYIKIVAKYCAEEKTHEEICDLFKYAVKLWNSNKHYQAIANMQVAKSRFEKEKSYDDVADCDFYLNKWFAVLDLNPKTSM